MAVSPCGPLLGLLIQIIFFGSLPAGGVAHNALGQGLPYPVAQLPAEKQLRPLNTSRRAFAVTPNCKFFVTSGHGLHFWDASNNARTRVVPLTQMNEADYVVFSPDGEYFAACSQCLLCVGETKTGRLRLEAAERIDYFSCLQFSGDGKYLIAITHNLTLLQWELSASKIVRRQPNVCCADFARKGHALAAGTLDGRVLIWHADTDPKPATLTSEKHGITAIAFSPDGKSLAWGCAPKDLRGRDGRLNSGGGSIRVWSVQDRAERWGQADTCVVSTLVFSPDGQRLVSTDRETRLCLWDVGTGRLLAHMPDRMPDGLVPDDRCVCAFTPDSKKLVWSADSRILHEWDIASNRQVRSWGGSHGQMKLLRFTPDGSKLVTCGDFMCTWDFASGKLLNSDGGHLGFISAMVFSCDSRFFASHDDLNGLGVWDRMSGRAVVRPVDGLHGPVQYFDFGDNNTLLTVGKDGVARIWDLERGEPVRQFRVGSSEMSAQYWPHVDWTLDNTSRAKYVVCDPTKRILAVVSEKYVIRLWDLKSGQELCQLPGHQGPPALEFSPDGSALTSLDAYGNLRLWQTCTGKEIKRIRNEATGRLNLVFSPDSRLLAVRREQTMEFWKVDNGDRISRLADDKECFHRAVLVGNGRFLVSGRNVASLRCWDVASGKATSWAWAGEDPKDSLSLRVWPNGAVVACIDQGTTDCLREAETGRTVGVFRRACDMALCPRGLLFVVWSAGNVSFHELCTGQRVCIVPQPSLTAIAGAGLVFSADGRFLAIAGADGTIKLWELRRLVGLTGMPQLDPTAANEREWWTALGSRDVKLAFKAMGHMIANPGAAVGFLQHQMRPAAGDLEERVGKLMADLDHANYRSRALASRALIDLGFEGYRALRQADPTKLTVEGRRRLEAALADPGMQNWSSESLQQMRAIRVLEQIDDPHARELLSALAAGSEKSRQTTEARAALENLKVRQ